MERGYSSPVKKEDKPKSKLEIWTMRILGALLIGPVILAVIVGLLAALIRFIQICIAWVS